MTSAAKTMGTTTIRIDRRKIWPIGRRIFRLIATIHGVSARE
jgi:hypothetical protein